MAPTSSFPLRHPKDCFALSVLLLLTPILLLSIFLGKQSVSVLSLSLSSFSNFSLARSPAINPSHSRDLLHPTQPPPSPPRSRQSEIRASVPLLAPQQDHPLPPFLPPTPGDDSSEADEEDGGEDEDSTALLSRLPAKDSQIPLSEQAARPLFKLGFASAAVRDDRSVRTREAKKCDLYKGTWVRDGEGRYPLYAPGSCPYVDEAFSCQENGREDDDYLKWQWKPDDCELPRFNGTDFLERVRGKKLMLVGDSMNRNQFESMLCILWEVLPDKSRMYETRGYKITKGRGYFNFFFPDYNCTISFVRSHFLVREGTRVNRPGSSSPVLMIDRICKSSTRWKTADILIFNTGHWWSHGKTSRGKNYFKEGDAVFPQFDANEAFRRSMQTWGGWIDRNFSPATKIVFFRGYSTAHFRGGDWDSGGTCHGETSPAWGGPILDSYPLKMNIMEEVKGKMNFPLILLNVTKLTNYRKDAHPSIYGRRVMKGEKVSKKRQDCSHWCLPGVPDAWNELIYANLVLGLT